MDDKQLLNVSDDESLGRVEIAPEVIEVIAGIAANDVSGSCEYAWKYRIECFRKIR